MNITPKLGLRKPEDSDFYNVEDFNYNMDVLDSASSSSSELTIGQATAVTKGLRLNLIVGAEPESEE